MTGTKTYIAMQWQYWGKAKKKSLAKAMLAKAAGYQWPLIKDQGKMVIYECEDPEAYVNEMGDIVYHKPYPEPVRVDGN